MIPPQAIECHWVQPMSQLGQSLPICCCCGIAADHDGIYKKKGRLRCRKEPKSREETPNEGSDSGVGPGDATAYA